MSCCPTLVVSAESHDLVDAWTTGPGFTIPSDAPDRRTDYVYLVAGLTAHACSTVLGELVGGVRASDHLGVLCEGGRQLPSALPDN